MTLPTDATAVRIESNTIYFENDRQQNFDAIILATGYRHNLNSILALSGDSLDDMSKAISKQSFFGKDGLYLCGFFLSPMGMLREIGIDARKIARDIAKKNTAAV